MNYAEFHMKRSSAVHSRWANAGLSGTGNNVDDDNDQCSRELASGNVHLITTMNQWEEKMSEANKNAKTVVVNFSATWCTPCRNIVPTYIELSDKYSSTIFLTVDVDELAELSNTWDVKATPSFFFLKDGQVSDKLVGANKTDLQKKVMAFAGSNSPIVQ